MIANQMFNDYKIAHREKLYAYWKFDTDEEYF